MIPPTDCGKVPYPNPVTEFLKQRAAGMPRRRLHQLLQLPWSETTSIGMEHNALVYAGHTVWNMGNERIEGHYKGGVKYRPREDWIIQRHTHPALISDEQAEALLRQIESPQAQKISETRRTPAKYLLTGLLKTPAGDPWHGDGKQKQYRVVVNGKKGKAVIANSFNR